MGLCLLEVTTLNVVKRRKELRALLGQSKLDATYDVMKKTKPRVSKSKEVTTHGVVKSEIKPKAF